MGEHHAAVSADHGSSTTATTSVDNNTTTNTNTNTNIIKARNYLRHHSHAIAGTGSGLIAAIIVTPLDVIKVRLQMGTTMKYKGTIKTFITIWKDEGIAGLFSGLSPSLLAYVPDRAIWFSIYHYCKVNIGKEMDNIRVRKWVDDDHAFIINTGGFYSMHGCDNTDMGGENTDDGGLNIHMAQTIIITQGWKALYKGLGPSLLGISHSLVMFPLYERLKIMILEYEQQHGIQPTDGGRIGNWGILAASSVSKCIASLVTYPHEVIRTRLQTQTTKTHLPLTEFEEERLFWKRGEIGVNGGAAGGVSDNGNGKPAGPPLPKYRGVIQTAKTIIAEEGLSSMYRGMGT
ncbi:hypothetical protein HDU76_012111, partial [Blyttiomyces sp. JEL0837]